MSNESQAPKPAPPAPTGASSASPASRSHDPSTAPSSANPAPSNGTPTAGTKRKRNPQSRGVANLTPEQLERKRANDREAQRAIRERTKNHIDRLNAEIRELKSQQPYRDLQNAIAQKNAVVAENDELRRRIMVFVEGVRPLMGGMLDGLANAGQPVSMGLDELAAAATAVPHHPTEPTQASNMYNPSSSSYPSVAVSHMASPSVTQDVASPTSGLAYRYQTVAPTPLRSWTPPEPPADPNIHPDLAGAAGAVMYSNNNSSDERLGLGYLLDNGQQQKGGQRVADGVSAPPTATSPASVPQGVYASWSTLPRNSEPTCPLDALLLTCLDERRLFAKNGTNVDFVGPAYPNFNALINPDTSCHSHPLSKVMTDLLRAFPDLSDLPEQVAVLYIMFLVMRWEVQPTRENYERLPSWMTPRPSQLFNPHPAWFDYLVFPLLRDATIHSQPHVQLSDFFIPFTRTLSLNWPYEPNTVLLSTSTSQPPPVSPSSRLNAAASSEEPVYVINPAFESHLRKLENWTLGRQFAEEFPDWRSCVNLKLNKGEERATGAVR